MAVYDTFRSFKLRKKDGFHTLILLTQNVNNIEQFNQDAKALEKQLIEDKVEPCTILIDRLLVRRSQHLRFLEAKFDGKHLDLNSLKFIEIEQTHCVREHTSKALAKNKKLLNESFLKKSQKRQILRGEIL